MKNVVPQYPIAVEAGKGYQGQRGKAIDMEYTELNVLAHMIIGLSIVDVFLLAIESLDWYLEYKHCMLRRLQLQKFMREDTPMATHLSPLVALVAVKIVIYDAVKAYVFYFALCWRAGLPLKAAMSNSNVML